MQRNFCRRNGIGSSVPAHAVCIAIRSFLPLICLIALPCFGFGSGNICFQVKGELSVTSIQPNGSVFKAGKYGFEVAVSNDCWQITAIYASSHFQVYGCDGTNICTYLSDPNVEGLNIVAGQIAPAPYPPVASWHVTVPWLAYASRSYFRDSVSNEIVLPAPWRAASHEPAAHIYKARLSELSEPFQIP